MSQSECGIQFHQIIEPGTQNPLFGCDAIWVGYATEVHGIKYSHEVGLPDDQRTKTVTHISFPTCELLVKKDECAWLNSL